MGDVVEFKRFRSRHPRSEASAPAGGAQILFFLGVRYERHEPAQPSPHLKKRRRASAAGTKPNTKTQAKRRKSKRTA